MNQKIDIMRKLYEYFHFQKRIVFEETIWRNTLVNFHSLISRLVVRSFGKTVGCPITEWKLIEEIQY